MGSARRTASTTGIDGVSSNGTVANRAAVASSNPIDRASATVSGGVVDEPERRVRGAQRRGDLVDDRLEDLVGGHRVLEGGV
jgi:hypothetical protein